MLYKQHFNFYLKIIAIDVVCKLNRLHGQPVVFDLKKKGFNYFQNKSERANLLLPLNKTLEEKFERTLIKIY